VRSIIALTCLAAAAAFIAESGAAQQPSGSTVGVIPAAAAAGVTGSRVLALDAPIFMGDQVNTDGMGEVQIRFRDDTRIVIGPNSLLTIDRFVFNPDNTAEDVALNYVRGTFRFISGISPSENYSLRSPTMTIGIRGSAHDFSNGAFVLLEGTATLCHPTTGRCVDVSEPCSVVVSDGNTIRVVETETERLARLQSGIFQYISGSQSTLQPDFQFDTARLCGIAPTQQASQGGGAATVAGLAALAGLAVVVTTVVASENPISP
jgi:hypothetical protein